MRQKCLLWIFLLPVMSLAQSPAPLIQNVYHRNVVSLNGDWHYILDPYDTGTASPDTRRRYYQNASPATATGVVEYDFAKSPSLHVPGDWNSQRPELLYYEGTVWYEKTFSYHPQPGKSTFLYLGAANYRTHIWLNGESLCEHEGGFTPFNCDASKLLKSGANFIVIAVNATRHTDDVPAAVTDWWNYGGITRDVMLVEMPHTFVEDYFVQLERGSMSRISGWVRVANASAPLKITVRIPELNISKDVTTGADGVAPIAFDAHGLQLWSPETPRLYRIEIASEGDHVSDEIGFRSIEVRGTEILLNGKPIFLRGVSIHEESPYHASRAHGDDDARTLLGWAKELGCNYVRLAHYPHDEHMTRMADRMGIMVWSEIPLWQGIDWGNHAVFEKAKQQLTEMITRDKNRTAIALWSLTNESRSTPERNAFIHELAVTARGLDSTRLLTAAMNRVTEPEKHAIVLDDPIIADLDVAGANEYLGWYEGVAADLDTTTWPTAFNKPLVISEFGADAKFGLHGVASERWTEEFQEDVFNHQLAALRKVPYLRGMSPWVLKDFRSPRRTLVDIQDGFNRKGLFSDTGERKKAFYVLQQFYREKAGEGSSTEK